MIIDVSHLNDAGFSDVAALSTKPFVATHSNSRNVYDLPRNLSDEQFSYIVAIQGLVGLSLYKGHIANEPTLNGLFAHVEHYLSLGGEDTVALGADFDGGEALIEIDNVGKYDILYKYLLK